jgi:hypothetical protein
VNLLLVDEEEERKKEEEGRVRGKLGRVLWMSGRVCVCAWVLVHGGMGSTVAGVVVGGCSGVLQVFGIGGGHGTTIQRYLPGYLAYLAGVVCACACFFGCGLEVSVAHQLPTSRPLPAFVV